MRDHAVYWTAKMHEGAVLAFGPVATREGLRLPKGENPVDLVERDPVIRTGLGFRFEVHPMRGATPGR